MNGEPFFWVRNRKGEIRIGRGEIEEPDLILRGTPSAIAGYVYAGAPLSSIQVEGRFEAGCQASGTIPDAGKGEIIARLRRFAETPKAAGHDRDSQRHAR